MKKAWNRKGIYVLLSLVLALTTVLAAGPAKKAAAAATGNLAQNPGFEAGALDEWAVSGTEAAALIKNSAADAHSQSYAFNYWSASDYTFRLSQTVTGLADGVYELSAWASGGGGEARLKLFAEGYGGSALAVDAVNTGWGKWTKYTISNIQVTSGQLTLGFDVEAPGDVWGYFDDFELKRAEGPAEAEEFIKGVDISTLQAIEDAGLTYYQDGARTDLLTIMKDHGVNYVRLRVWNDPVQAGGYNDKDKLLEMAERVKAAGLKLLVDFHYSDFWADPGQQVKPDAWKALTFTELKQAVYDYTAEVLSELAASGAYPDMVQVGNEINNGMIHPDGSTANFANLTQLLKEGVRAVRETTPDGHETKIMLHLAEGGDNHKFVSFFDQVEAAQVDYDVIGMSYYPYWHGTFQQLKTNMDDMAARYGKQIVVAETAYPHTLEDGDGHGNIAGADQVRIAGFEASPDNQRLVTELVMNTVAHVRDGKGLGVFYWEPAWLPEVGWKVGEGNGWENQAMFDFDGNALSSLDAFKFTPGGMAEKLPVMVYASPAITVAKGSEPALPATASVLYNEGSISQAAVSWEEIAEGRLNEPGAFTLEGTVAGLEQKASVGITVLANPNMAENAGFEEGSLDRWTLSGTEGSGKVENNTGNAHSGAYAFNYWNSSTYAYRLTQTVTGLADGTYTLKAWSSGGGGETKLKLFAETAGADVRSVDIVNTGYNVWKPYTVTGIVVKDGQATIGFDVEAPAQVWGYFDDIELVMDPQEEPAPGGTGNTGASPEPEPSPGQVTVTTGQIAEKADGTATVKLPEDVTEVVLPSGVYGKLIKPVTFETGDLSVTIPAEVFGQLQSLVPGASGGSITLKLMPIAPADIKGLLAQSGKQTEHTEINAAGQGYEFKLSIRNGAGEEAELSQFSKPVKIRLKGDAGSIARHTGIYYLSEDGALEYAGGEWSEGEWTAQVEHFSMYAVLEITKRFDDVPESYWAYEAIGELAAKQMLLGVTDSAFEPGREMSRAEFAALLARALKLKGRTEHSFADVAADAWYGDELSAAYAAGIIRGRSETRFAPESLITRQEMAVMLVRAYAYLTGGDAATGKELAYADADEAAEWAVPSIGSATRLGLLNGRSRSLFEPGSFMTRAEAAQAVSRLIGL